jgi:hypothetical protein
MPLATGIDLGDCCGYLVSDTYFQCFSWRNTARNRVEAVVYAVLPNSAWVAVWGPGVVSEATGDGVVDDPKCVAQDGFFVVQWIEVEGESTALLYRNMLNLANLDAGWASAGAGETVGSQVLHGLCILEGTTDMIVSVEAYSSTEVRVRRSESPFNWTSDVYEVLLTLSCTQVLAVDAHDTDNTVGNILILWGNDSVSQQLYMTRVDADDGTSNQTSNLLFNEAAYSGLVIPMAVGARRLSANNHLVAAEFAYTANFAAGSPDDRVRRVAIKRVLASTATEVNYNMHAEGVGLVSRPFLYASGTAGVDNAFVGVSHASASDAYPYQSMAGFVLDLRYQQFAAATADAQVQPVPVASINCGALFDGRCAGTPGLSPDIPYTSEGKRNNHISNTAGPPHHAMGPDLKSVVFAGMFFERLSQSSAGALRPVNAAVRGVVFYPDEPFTSRRDDEPSALADNFKICQPRSLGRAVEIGGVLVFAGAMPSVYDGTQVVELGWPWLPEILDLAADVLVGDGFGAGTYYICATYEWRDSKGHLHRSAPSQPISITLDTDEDIIVRVRCMGISVKDADFHYPSTAPIEIAIWHSVDEGQTFYRTFAGSAAVLPIGDTPQNDRDEPWLDVTLTSGGTPFSTSSELLSWSLGAGGWNLPVPMTPPPLRVIEAWNNRLFGASEDGVLYYSDEVLPAPGGSENVVPEFWAENAFRYPWDGEIVAMQVMDNDLIVFTRDAIYAMGGQGNDGTGQGATLSVQVIERGTGCLEPKSVVLAPPGIFFQSDKGVYLLNRGKQPDYVSAGAAIEERIRRMGNLRGAVLLPDRHQIRFVGNDAPGTTADPAMLIYDYLHRQWSWTDQFPLLAGASTALNTMQATAAYRAIAGETLHVVLQQGGLAVERAASSTVYADENYTTTVAIPIDIQTEWIHLAGIAGLKRIREIAIQVERENDSDLSCDVWYDENGTFDETTAYETYTWASGADDFGVIRPSRQKVSAVMLRIYESGTVAQTENIRVVSITIEIGTKTRIKRVGSGAHGALQ